MISKVQDERCNKKNPLQFLRIHSGCCFAGYENNRTYKFTHTRVNYSQNQFILIHTPDHTPVARNIGIWNRQRNSFRNSSDTQTVRNGSATHSPCSHNYILRSPISYRQCKSYQKLLKRKTRLLTHHMISVKCSKTTDEQEVVAASTLLTLPYCLF